ncbi:MAG: hypothetical protein RIQ49_2449 [Pseudomonadota bacterium]
MFGNIRVNQVGRNWRNLIKPCLTELAFDIVFAGKSKATVKLQARIGRFPACLCCKILCHIRLRTTGLALVKEIAGCITHQVCRFDFDEGVCYRKLHTLILTNGSSENLSILHISGDPIDEPVAIADALGRDQDSFGIKPIKNVLKAALRR